MVEQRHGPRGGTSPSWYHRNVVEHLSDQKTNAETSLSSKDLKSKSIFFRFRIFENSLEKTTTVEKKRKRTKAVSGLEISDTDSWGMNTPGIPKIARLVMQRDRQRQKETTQRQNASHRSETIEAEELKTEDFFNAFSELEAYRSEHAQNTETVERLSGAFQRELLRLPNFEAPQISSTSENLESSLESPHTPSFHSDPKFEYSESTDLTDDEETRHLKQELLILKQELKDSPLSNCKDQTDS